MSIDIQFSTVANSISEISIPGITIKDIDNIPENCLMLCPLIIPDPDMWITEFEVVDDSIGIAATRQRTLRYTLNYLYLHTTIGGSLGGLLAVYAGMVENMVTIANALLTNEDITGAVEQRMTKIGDIMMVSDPAGNQYFGTQISLRVMEFIN